MSSRSRDTRSRPAVLALAVGLVIVLTGGEAFAASQRPVASAQRSSATSQSGAFQPGSTTDLVTTLTHEDQQYALFLPAQYDSSRKWPVLFVLDPRGRALMARDLFVSAAAELGYIVMSSYQSRSDTSPTVTARAFEALLGESQRRFSVDLERLYLGGMSGTSHASFRFALALSENIAGVIGCGGGLPQELESPGDGVTFAYFGITGTTDFNYQGQLRLDRQLAKLGSPRRLEVFEGRHGWPPDDTLTNLALRWMELQAMRAGAIPPRTAWLSEQLSAQRARARSLDDPFDALQAWRQIVADFQGLADLGEVASEIQRLEALAQVSRTAKLEARLARQEEAYLTTRYASWLRDLRSDGEQASTPGRALRALGVEGLLERSRNKSESPRRARSAERLLESLYVDVSYYLPDEFLARDQYERAAITLEVAIAIWPERPRAHWRLAEAYARWGKNERALERLRGAFRVSRVDVARLQSDPQWSALRQLPQWQELLKEARKPASSSPR